MYRNEIDNTWKIRDREGRVEKERTHSKFDRTERGLQKLANSVILFEGNPNNCFQSSQSGASLDLYDPLDKILTSRVHINDADISLISPPLGYVNIGQGSLFLERLPVRQYKAGVSRSNMTIRPNPGEGLQHTRRTIENIMNSNGFFRTIKGEFPSFIKCVDEFQGMFKDSESLAFDRFWEVSVNPESDSLLTLRHITKDIGTFNIKSGEIILRAKSRKFANIYGNLLSQVVPKAISKNIVLK